ncbi:FTS and Hook-interacting protein-like isoform X2 [Lytechinus variegatus]|uniref:FTS and Hook-interacting protein-like isoform X2 n=1 Tax=Lytechinus variegatus TaxID=7654 RepID=UPI001BB0E2BD|nr:FTS and Hook-interacting protein-like isoform X2 [Lytechinus variegatus]
MSRFLRRRSNTATPTVSSPPPSASHHSQERALSPEAEAQQVRLEVYLNHWQQIQAIVNKVFNSRRSWSKVTNDDVQTVVNYTIQMMHLLVEEEAPAQGTIGRLLEILIQENILEKLYIWSERAGDFQEDAKRELLKIYELIIGQCKQSVLMHPAILNPLLRLLLACWEHSREDTERQLIPLLQALCISLSQDPNLLEFLFHASPSKGPAKFLLFSLLIPYIHREGLMGQQARDALLLCISVSAEAKHIGKYIADSTNLCPVLAGGLGALYSRLPGKLDISPDHWHRITHEDLANMPDLAMFLNSLEFCNAVVQVAHPLVSDQLVQFFHDGFLVPVIGPALHQFSHADILRNTSDLNLNEEIVSATAYVEIFLRSISDPRLMRAFLRYLCLGWYDNTTIMESLIRRIGTNSKLCVVTLSLFNTLLDVNCEDVMVELILKYLVPCTHVMASQRRAIKDLDFYGKWAEKFISLSPVCCKPLKDTSKDKDGHRDSKTDLLSQTRNMSDIADTQSNGTLDAVRMTSKEHVMITGSNQSLNNATSIDSNTMQQNGHGRQTPELSAASNISRTSDSDTLSQASRLSSEESVCDIESSHIEYLLDARHAIIACSKSCKQWSASYDGLNPAPTILSPDVETPGPGERFRFNSVPSIGNRSQQTTPRHESTPIHELTSDVNQNKRTLDSSNEQPLSRSHDSDKYNALEGTLSSTIQEVLQMSIGDESAKKEEVDNDVSLADIFQGENLSIVELVDSMDKLKARDADESNESQEESSQGDSDDRSSGGNAKHFLFRKLALDRSDVMSEESRLSSTSHSRQDSLFEFEEPGIFWQFDSDLEATPNRRMSSTGGGGYFFDDPFEHHHSGHDNGDLNGAVLHNHNGFLDSGEFPTSFHTNGTSSLASPLSFDEDIDENHFTLSDPDTPQSGASSGKSSPLHDGESPRRAGPKTNYNLPRPAGLQLASVGNPGALPVGKITGAPTIGPFMVTIFAKLDSMMENSLYVNLLLTGIISRLACYPQPLLRSFLLNTNMVFQPSVRSLTQVLTSVRSRLDAYAAKVDKWDTNLHKAKQYLMTRESPEEEGLNKDRSWSMVEERDRVTLKPRSGTLTTIKQVTRRGSLSDMFLKRRNRSIKSSEKQKLSAIRESGILSGESGAMSPETAAQYESLKSRNAVYSAVVLDEFVKELAALAQEHAVLSVEEL